MSFLNKDQFSDPLLDLFSVHVDVSVTVLDMQCSYNRYLNTLPCTPRQGWHQSPLTHACALVCLVSLSPSAWTSPYHLSLLSSDLLVQDNGLKNPHLLCNPNTEASLQAWSDVPSERKAMATIFWATDTIITFHLQCQAVFHRECDDLLMMVP